MRISYCCCVTTTKMDNMLMLPSICKKGTLSRRPGGAVVSISQQEGSAISALVFLCEFAKHKHMLVG